MKNWIGGELPLTKNLCAVSLILTRKEDHAYILIESLNEKNEITAFEAHLGSPDEKFATITTMDTNLDRLISIARNNKSRSWGISRKQMEQLKASIFADQTYFQEHRVRYVKGGEAKGAGLFGASLDTIGSQKIKQASTDSNDLLIDSELDFLQRNKSLKRSVESSAHSVHHSVDYLLRSGPNCASWAKGRLQALLGIDFKETTWEKMAACVIITPRQVVTPGFCIVS